MDELKIVRNLLDFDIESKEVTTEESDEEAAPKGQRTTSGSQKKFTYRTKEGTAPIMDPSWQDVFLLSFELPKDPFKQIRKEVDELQNMYARLEHIVRHTY